MLAEKFTETEFPTRPLGPHPRATETPRTHLMLVREPALNTRGSEWSLRATSGRFDGVGLLSMLRFERLNLG